MPERKSDELAGAETMPATARGHKPAPAAGTRIDRFVVEAELGRGGMGLVVAAHDPTLDRRVAIKLLRPGAAANEDTHGARARLLREAQAMARLAHPNVLTVHEVGEVDEQVFVVMELVDGQTIGRWAAKRGWRELLAAYVDAGRGLAAAHRANLVHRDFKPDNVLVGADRRVRVTDFGLAAASEDPVLVPAGLATSPALDALTRTGEVIGTPYYMAPEQHDGAAVDARADQFAFCVALWEALYRQRPFVGASYEDLHRAVSAGTITPPPDRTEVPRRLETILRRGLSIDPAARWPDMDALLAALTDDPARRARLRLAAAGLAVVVGGLALAVVLLARRGGDEGPRPCTGLDGELAEVWGPAARGDVERAFTATGLPHAGDSFARTAARLDAYAGAWTAMRVDSCEATHVRGVESPDLLDRRTACLDQRRAELAGLVGRLREADRGAVNRATEAAVGLPALDACADLPGLLAQTAPPPDPALRAQVEQVRLQVSDARAHRLTGAFAAGLPLARKAAQRARATGYAPLMHDAFSVVGELESHTGDFAAAEASFHAAHEAATQAGDTAGAAELMVNIADTTFRQSKYQEAAALIRVALGALVQGHPDAQAAAHSVMGNIARAQGDWDGARREYEQALKLRRRPDGDPLREAASLDDLGRLAIESARFDEAETHLAAALAIKQRMLGERHPNVASSLGNLAIVARERGRVDEAIERMRAALAIMEPAEGSASPRIGTLYTNLGVLLDAKGRSQEALAMMQRGLAIREKALPPDHPERADSMMNIGVVLDEGLHRPAEALPWFEKALASLERKLPPDHPNLAFPLHGIGSCLAQLGKPRPALPYLERALKVRSGDDVPPSLRAATLTVLADVLWSSAADRRRALALAREARDLYRADKDDDAATGMDRWLAAHGG